MTNKSIPKNNKGKGHSQKIAKKIVSGNYVIIQDADLEYSPNDYEKIIEPFLNNNADVVYGSRFQGSSKKRIIYFKNKLLKGLWSLNAVTLSAQILTLPIVLYHFHQFPTLFLFTNIFAVPFSGFILYDALLLLVTYYIPYVGAFVGKTVGAGVALMNYVIGSVDALPFSVWPALQITTLQVIFLFVAIIGISKWLIQKSYHGMMIGLFGILLFTFLRSIDFLEKNNQTYLTHFWHWPLFKLEPFY